MDVAQEQLNCPICSAQLSIEHSRNKAAKLFAHGKIQTEKWYRIVHARHPSDCKLRYENLGEGETESEAWANFRKNLQTS